MPRRVKRSIGNEYFESLFNKVPEAIALCDNQGRILKINAEFRRMFGYTPAETSGLSIDDLVAPAHLHAEAAVLTNQAAGGETFSVEAVRKRKDGSCLHVSIMGAPILVHGKQVAVYGIYRDISDRKAAEEALMLSQRELLEANAQLEQLSNMDGLTGIPNRRYFEHRLEVEWRRACRHGEWVSLIMVDVDFFKNYNDLHGHLAGDECLKRIARALAEKTRAEDSVARYGGEEFVALVTHNTAEGALLVAERMRQQVQELEIAHGQSSVSPCVSVSLGVASQLAVEGSHPTDLLRRADEALYLAKFRGRNRVELAKDGLL